MGNEMSTRIERAEKTGVFALENEGIDEIPAQLFNIHQKIRSIDLSKNKFTKLPPKISQFENLKMLTISENRLNQLCKELFSLKNLEMLNLTQNMLSQIPSEIGQLSKLKKLYLANNQLTRLPNEIANLKKLEILDCQFNKLNMLPENLDQCQELMELNADKNEIKVVPNSLAKIPLRLLSIKHNLLQDFPAEILKNPRVGMIEIEGNPLTMEKFREIDGYNEYHERRKGVVNKAIQGGADYKLLD